MIKHSVLSKKIESLSLSPTLALTAQTKELQNQGIDIISLAAGAPDLRPPQDLIEALKHAAGEEKSFGYTGSAGLIELRESISQWLQEKRQLIYSSQQILITSGCKLALFQALYALLDPGYEVLIGAPYWVSYPQMTIACQGTPVIVPTGSDSRYLVSAQNLESYLTAQSKVLILNSPHNPTGQVHSQEELLALAVLLRKHPQIIILCDDIYDTLVKDPLPHLLHVAPDLFDRVIVVNGLSKSFGLTGWRLGFAAGPKKIIDAMTKLQSQTTTCVSTPVQYAAIAAYQYFGQDRFYQQSFQIYQERAKKFIAELSDIKSIVFSPLVASFYLWIDLRALLQEKSLSSAQELGAVWLKELHIAVVPGEDFGYPGYIRISLTAPEDRLIEAAKKIAHWALS